MPLLRTEPRRSRRIAAALAALAALAGCSGAESSRSAPPSGVMTADAPTRPAAVIPAPAAQPAPVQVAPIAPPVAAAPIAPAPVAPVPQPGAFAPQPAGQITHVVRKGDTVYSLGRRYGVTPADIQRANNLDAAFTIKIDQRLTIPSGGALPAAPAATTIAPAAPAAPIAPSAQSRPMIRPVDGQIVSAFGAKAGSAPNDGVDIAAPAGAPVRAAADGVVAYVSQPHPQVGSVVLIRHPGGMLTVYGLVDGIAVAPGQNVAQGAPIARVAPSRAAEPSRLHFEIRRGSEPVDPTPYI